MPQLKLRSLDAVSDRKRGVGHRLRRRPRWPVSAHYTLAQAGRRLLWMPTRLACRAELLKVPRLGDKTECRPPALRVMNGSVSG
jgi:hypothetical protein